MDLGKVANANGNGVLLMYSLRFQTIVEVQWDHFKWFNLVAQA